MSEKIRQLIENNRRWAEQFEASNPGIFNKLARQQTPHYLWIGCSDSRVPANTIIGLQPGEVFVHRNVANLVHQSDLNVISVIDYAVNHLKVTDIILCGHYGCGGVKAAIEHKEHGIVDNWLGTIRDIYSTHKKRFQEITCEQEEVDLLCELNVVEQVRNVCHTSIVQKAWAKGQKLAVHGVIYSVKNGLLNDLSVSKSSLDEIEMVYRMC